MRNILPIAFTLLTAAWVLTGCGSSLTYQSDDEAWKAAREAGDVAESKGDYATAEAKFKEAVQHARRIQVANPHHLAETLEDLAQTYTKEKKLDEAKAAYQEVIQVCSSMEQNKEASELYKRVARYSQAGAFSALGKIYVQEKDYKNAKLAYSQGLKIDAARSGMVPVIADLKRNYADLLDVTGEDPTLARELRDQASAASDEILEGL